MYDYNCQGHAVAVRDVPTFHKKLTMYDTIVQTTNQAATSTQSLTAIAEYQVAAPQIQIGDHISGINIFILTPKGQAVT